MDHVQACRSLGACALLLGERLEPRGLERQGPALPGLIALAGPGPGQAFAFRWGAVVLIGAAEGTAAALAAQLRSRLRGPLASPFEETARLRLDPLEEGPDEAGVIRLHDLSLPRQALVAELLARSTLLSYQEVALAQCLDRMGPILATLRRGRSAPSHGILLRSLGEALAARAQAAACADTSASPELLWDHPELSDLHARIAAEWQLPERNDALGRKLAVIREVAEAILSLTAARRSRALELGLALVVAVQLAAGLQVLLAP